MSSFSLRNRQKPRASTRRQRGEDEHKTTSGHLKDTLTRWCSKARHGGLKRSTEFCSCPDLTGTDRRVCIVHFDVFYDLLPSFSLRLPLDPFYSDYFNEILFLLSKLALKLLSKQGMQPVFMIIIVDVVFNLLAFEFFMMV